MLLNLIHGTSSIIYGAEVHWLKPQVPHMVLNWIDWNHRYNIWPWTQLTETTSTIYGTELSWLKSQIENMVLNSVDWNHRYNIWCWTQLTETTSTIYGAELNWLKPQIQYMALNSIDWNHRYNIWCWTQLTKTTSTIYAVIRLENIMPVHGRGRIDGEAMCHLLQCAKWKFQWAGNSCLKFR